MGFKGQKIKANDLHNIASHKTDFNNHHCKHLRSPAVLWLLRYLHKKEVKTTVTATTESYESYRSEVKQL
jgi:hypothetical protein